MALTGVANASINDKSTGAIVEAVDEANKSGDGAGVDGEIVVSICVVGNGVGMEAFPERLRFP